MSQTTDHLYGPLVIMRPPVPATCNKAGANYKSEVPHLEYFPRRAYLEWLSIADAVVEAGGDAIFQFEESDDVLLDVGDLHVDGNGAIRPSDSQEELSNIKDVMTGRIFTANGPWASFAENTIRACLPNMLAHRVAELPYYEDLLARLAESAGASLEMHTNPHRFEGMADVVSVNNRVLLTHTVAGHYDEGSAPKTTRSSLKGVTFAADIAQIPEEDRIYLELAYPHFHGDTVHFTARTTIGHKLVHFRGGLWGEDSIKLIEWLPKDTIVPLSREDAVSAYAGNCRQVGDTVLAADGASEAFHKSMKQLGLKTVSIELHELFGKAGGGPGCATLHLPSSLQVPKDSPLRYSNQRNIAYKRADRIATRLAVDPNFFAGKRRG